MIRTLWFYVVLFVSTMWHGSVAIVAGLLGVAYRPGGVYDWTPRNWSRWILAAAGTPVVIVGLEQVPRDRAVVYASNHSSAFDIWALFATLPGSLRFVAKQELARVFVLGRAMAAGGQVFIDRSHAKHAQEAYELAAATMRRGISTIVFPEGTRSTSGEFLPFKTMPFGLAIAAQVPLVPVYVHNTFEIFPKGARRLRPRPIQIWVGAPIDTTGTTLADRAALRDRALAVITAFRQRVDEAVTPD